MAEGGLSVPALDDMPVLMWHEQFALETYLDVSGSRRPSMGELPGPVPMSEIAASYSYLRLHEHFTRHEWMKLVQALDSALREHSEKASKGRPPKPPP